MKPRLGVALLVAAAIAPALQIGCAPPARADSPRLIPAPDQIHGEFVALREPRPEVLVGALWIQGFGPHGQGAAADNLETVRGASNLAIGRTMQLSLTLGLLRLLGLDPALRNQVSVRFTDLGIVRVKDLSKLEGPTGEARIVETLPRRLHQN